MRDDVSGFGVCGLRVGCLIGFGFEICGFRLWGNFMGFEFRDCSFRVFIFTVNLNTSKELRDIFTKSESS